MAIITQTKLVGFGYGDKSNYNATTYANHIWFDPNNKQILLNGIEYVPKKLSELVNDKNFLTSITKSMVENVLTGTISTHTHTFASITSKPTTLNGYGITDAALASDLSKYLPLAGGTLTGNLTCNGSYITMNGASGAKGYKGYFNQSGVSNRAMSSHILGAEGYAFGSYAISTGANAYAGIRNQDADSNTYPYIAWQWMPSVKVNFTINNQETANGEFYGYEVLGGKMVQYEIGGNSYTYENTSNAVRVLVCVKDDEEKGLVFGGKPYLPYYSTKTLLEDKYILGRGEYITDVNTLTVNGVNYYMLAIYTWSATLGYDYATQVKVMCATKVNNSNYISASSYASGNFSVANGKSSVASGANSVASGYSSVASGYSSVASGYSSVASGAYSVASGAYSVASGANSVASGYSSVANNDYSVVLALNGETMAVFQTIVGRYNAKVPGLFIIGNGSASSRSNALVVDEQGNVMAKYFSGYANALGGEGFKIYPENTNQINFGGTGSDTTVVFGAASKDSRSAPTTYKFGADGTAKLQAAIATASNDGLMSSSMYSATVVKDLAVRQGSAMIGADGKPTDNGIFIRTSVSNLAGDAITATETDGIKIPNATATYDGSMSYTDKKKLDGISSYSAKSVSMLRLSFNSDATVSVIRGGGDYDMTQDAQLMESEYVEQTIADNLYVTTIRYDLSSASNNTLLNLFMNSFVRFGFMGKSSYGISNHSINVKSNFDNDTLDIQFVSTIQNDSLVVDCVWEFF